MLTIILDQTIVMVALPAIQRDLGFSQSSLAWVVNAYLIPFGGLLLLASRLGHLLGRYDALQIGLAFLPVALAIRTLSVDISEDLLVAGASLDSALTGGYHLAFGVSAGLVLASIAVAATVLRGAPLFTPAARVEKSVVRELV